MIRLTEEQFTEFKRFNDIEVFSEQEIIKAMNLSKIEKSSFDELNDDEKEVFKGVVDELSTFKKVEVLSPQPEGSMKRGSISTNYYIRPVQVEWIEEEITKSIDGEDVIEKARSGIYKDTPENKKLGRVGQKFGSKKPVEDKSASHKDFKPESKEHLEKKIREQYKKSPLYVQREKVKEAMDKYYPKNSEAQKKFQGDVASGKTNLKEMFDGGKKETISSSSKSKIEKDIEWLKSQIQKKPNQAPKFQKKLRELQSQLKSN